MAIHKVKVTGQLPVNDTAPGGETDLDDEVINVQALIDGEHVELLPESKPAKPTAAKKGDV